MSDTGRNSLTILRNINRSSEFRNTACRWYYGEGLCRAAAQIMLETVQGIGNAPEYHIVRRRMGNLHPPEPQLETGYAGPAPLINAPKIIRPASPAAHRAHDFPMQELGSHSVPERMGRGAVEVRRAAAIRIDHGCGGKFAVMVREREEIRKLRRTLRREDLVVSFGVEAEPIADARFAKEAVELSHGSAPLLPPHRNAVALGEPNVVAGFRMHRGKKLGVGFREGEHDRFPRLHAFYFRNIEY